MHVSTTIRVSDETRRRLAELAKTTRRPMTEVVDDAVDALERRVFFEEVNARYAELRADPVTWAEILAERAEWEGTLEDNLE